MEEHYTTVSGPEGACAAFLSLSRLNFTVRSRSNSSTCLLGPAASAHAADDSFVPRVFYIPAAVQEKWQRYLREG